MMEDAMAKVIAFYIPDSFPKKVNRIAPNEHGNVIEFRLPRGKGLTMQFHEPASHDPPAKEGAIPMWTFCISAGSVLVQRVTAGFCEIADDYRIGVFGCRRCSVRSPT
jgi:hypothetical protein